MVYRILVFLLLSSPSLCTTTTVSITDVGGVGDGVTSNTAAFVRAVAKLEAKGGGILLVASSTPSPSTFLTGPFNLSSHITLLVEGGATILGSVNIAEWPLMPPMPSYGQGRDHPGPRRVSLIHGFNMTNVTVTGDGTIDGNGAWWWARHKVPGKEQFTRGHLIEFMLHPVYCKRVYAHHLTITNDLHSPNTDGIDPDSTQDAVLAYNYISTGDDCYALKSGWDKAGYTYGVPTRNISIYGGYCESPTSAGICIGSEMSGGVYDVRVKDMIFNNTAYAFRLKSGVGRGGGISRIDFRDSIMINSSVGFEYSEYYGGHPQSGFDPTALPAVHSVHTENITGTAHSVANLRGLPQPKASKTSMYNITFKDVDVTGGSWACSNVYGSAHGTPAACTCLKAGCNFF